MEEFSKKTLEEFSKWLREESFQENTIKIFEGFWCMCVCVVPTVLEV